MSKIINLFGGPGIGKSSIASGITYKLKKKHITCDNPYEFPKLLAWDENHSAIRDQLYVLANQHRGIVKSYGKVITLFWIHQLYYHWYINQYIKVLSIQQRYMGNHLIKWC
jgi:broad-specificity NMP kinase